MPRAFLITNKRYNSAVEYDDGQVTRENSPERSVSTAEGLLGDLTESSESSEPSWKPASPRSPASLSRRSESPLSLTIRDQPVVQHFQPVVRHDSILAAVLQQVTSEARFAYASHTDNYVCPECGKRYSTSSNLARHRQTHRSVTDKKARKCPHCDKVYVSMPAFSMHVRTHGQGCQCPYCGKCFSRPWLLQGHIRTHTGEKPFKCPICNKAFADKSNLRAHIQTHSTTKPYVCQRCGKAFALKSYLYKHEESSCMRLQRTDRARPPREDTPSSSCSSDSYSGIDMSQLSHIESS